MIRRGLSTKEAYLSQLHFCYILELCCRLWGSLPIGSKKDSLPEMITSDDHLQSVHFPIALHGLGLDSRIWWITVQYDVRWLIPFASPINWKLRWFNLIIKIWKVYISWFYIAISIPTFTPWSWASLCCRSLWFALAGLTPFASGWHLMISVNASCWPVT